MKIFIFVLTLLFSTSSFSADFNFNCKNIKGVDLRYERGKIDSSSDGYSGTTFLLRADHDGGYVKWSGGMNDGFTEDLILLNVSNKDGWITWVSVWPEVTRIFTLFLAAEGGPQLSLTESQSQMFTNNPMARSFFSKCSKG